MHGPLVMAYMGDNIYEKYVREYLINKGITKVGELQNESLKYGFVSWYFWFKQYTDVAKIIHFSSDIFT